MGVTVYWEYPRIGFDGSNGPSVGFGEGSLYAYLRRSYVDCTMSTNRRAGEHSDGSAWGTNLGTALSVNRDWIEGLVVTSLEIALSRSRQSLSSRRTHVANGGKYRSVRESISSSTSRWTSSCRSSSRRPWKDVGIGIVRLYRQSMEYAHGGMQTSTRRTFSKSLFGRI